MILFSKGDLAEYAKHYVIPVAYILGAYAFFKTMLGCNNTEIVQMAYWLSSIFCAGALARVSTQTSPLEEAIGMGKLIDLLRVLRKLCS